MKLRNHTKYTKKQVEFVLSNFDTHSNKELAKALGISQEHVRSIYKCYGLVRSKYGKFRKGQAPWNKGMKGVKTSHKGLFVKGNKPPNHKPVGSTRITKDGYRERKVAEPRKWTAEHRLLWESVHGPIPEGMMIAFKKGGDKLNFRITDLECISKAEVLRRNPNRAKFSASIKRLWREAKEAAARGEIPKTRLRVRIPNVPVNAESAMFGSLV